MNERPEKHDFQKKWGQNFLRGDRYAQELVKAADVQKGDIVVEIGPGDGRVTNLLLQAGAKVLSIEVDYSLLPKLLKRFGDNKDFQLIHQDILQTDVVVEVEKLGWGNKFKVVGSLPYNISKKIIEQLITAQVQPVICAFIVQEEVAQDYAAKAPKASSLSNWVQLYAQAKKMLSIPKQQFHPAPKVNGGILQLIPHKNYDENTIQIMQKIIRVGFSSPRKTLWNNLRSLPELNKLSAAEFQEKFGFNEFVRPAELELSQWQGLVDKL